MIAALRCAMAIAMSLVVSSPLLADQQPHSGPPVYRPAPLQAPSRPIPPSRPAPPPPPPARPAPPPPRPAPPPPQLPGGFNLPRDVEPIAPHPIILHPVNPTQPPVRTQPPIERRQPPIERRQPPIVRTQPPIVRTQPPIVRTQPPNGPFPSGPYQHRHGPIIPNPHHWHHWHWNHGVVWYPAPIYWGWGFWGPWTIGITPGVILYGSVPDYNEHVIYPSYQIEQNSPGAQLLENYRLTQTPCGPPDLVVIWGPNNSVICAFPNDLVAAGNYELDPATLTLQSLVK